MIINCISTIRCTVKSCRETKNSKVFHTFASTDCFYAINGVPLDEVHEGYVNFCSPYRFAVGDTVRLAVSVEKDRDGYYTRIRFTPLREPVET